MIADVAASVLAKLKNKAKASGISYQQCLQLFFQEELLCRLVIKGQRMYNKKSRGATGNVAPLPDRRGNAGPEI